MIYSKNYTELYRRVMAGEHVLCLHYATNAAGWVYLTDDGRPVISNKASYAYNLGGTIDVFAERCARYSIQFVPDNEALIDWVKVALTDIKDVGGVTNSTLKYINEALKQYENE